MSAFDAIDLARLPEPDLVERLDFEAIYAAARADMVALWPEFDALVESEPAVKILQVMAYRELLLRQRVNEAGRQTMLAFAGGSNLDHIAALFGVSRAVIQAGDPDAVPPVPEILEDDERLRERVKLAPEAATAAGTAGRYAFHALDADPRVADVAVLSSYPGKVDVYILSSENEGAATADLLEAVNARLQSDDVRTLTDTVAVFAAEVVPYAVDATLITLPGSGGQALLDTAAEKLAAYTAEQYRIGRDVTRSGIYAALHVEGVQKVALASPTADVVVEDGQVARPSSLAIALGGSDD